LRLVDSHAHLQAERFADDADAVVAAARHAGVDRILVPGWNPWSCEAAVEVSERFPWLDAAVGVHPHDAANFDDGAWGRIATLATDDRVVAVGETGLDSDRGFSPWPDQLANLRRNLRLALETGKPAILHCRSRPRARDAQDALLGELRAAGVGGAGWTDAFGERPPAVIHSFSGPVDYARAMLDLNLAISFSGLVFRHGEEASAEVARLVPGDRLLVETDSPFLSPPGSPRGRNEPQWVRITAAWLAEQRNEPADRLGDSLIAAYDTTFRSPRRAGSG
jgi:TatD DNase family protein